MFRGLAGLSALSLLLGVACSRQESHVEKSEPARASSVDTAASASDTDVAPTDARASCVGEATAKRFAVYLHGMDSEPPSEQEQQNRKVLAAVARTQGVRFALPRASMACPTQADSVCWGWKFDDAEASAAATRVATAADQCFAGQQYGLLGFSNGGYLLNKLLRSCQLHALLPRAQWMISVGSAKFEGELEAQPSSLTGCGRLLLVSGRDDTYNFDPKHHLFELLAAKGAAVEHLEFSGGHILEEKSLGLAIQRSSVPHP